MPHLGDPTIDDQVVDLDPLSPGEREHVAFMHRWLELYNGDDMEAFAHHCYHPDFVLVNYDGATWTGDGATRANRIEGLSGLVAAERFVKRHAPRRRMRFNRLVAARDVVVVEASLLDDDRPGWELSWCGVYTFRDGLIISDHSYLNHRDWPGVSSMFESSDTHVDTAETDSRGG